jgi:hypothetical protein
MTEYERHVLQHAVQMAVKMVDDEVAMAKREMSIAGEVWTDEHEQFVKDYRLEYLKSLEVDYGREAAL